MRNKMGQVMGPYNGKGQVKKRENLFSLVLKALKSRYFEPSSGLANPWSLLENDRARKDFHEKLDFMLRDVGGIHKPQELAAALLEASFRREASGPYETHSCGLSIFPINESTLRRASSLFKKFRRETFLGITTQREEDLQPRLQPRLEKLGFIRLCSYENPKSHNELTLWLRPAKGELVSQDKEF